MTHGVQPWSMKVSQPGGVKDRHAGRYCTFSWQQWQQNLCSVLNHKLLGNITSFGKNKDIGWNQVTPRLLLHTSRAELETTRLISWQQILSRLSPPPQHGRDKCPITPPRQDPELLHVSCFLPVFQITGILSFEWFVSCWLCFFVVFTKLCDINLIRFFYCKGREVCCTSLMASWPFLTPLLFFNYQLLSFYKRANKIQNNNPNWLLWLLLICYSIVF